MSSNFDAQTKGDIAELYLKPVTDTNARYKRDTDLRVLFDDQGKPQYSTKNFTHVAIYHDLEGICSQYHASTVARVRFHAIHGPGFRLTSTFILDRWPPTALV